MLAASPLLLTSVGKEVKDGEGVPYDVKIHMDPSPARVRAMGPYT